MISRIRNEHLTLSLLPSPLRPETGGGGGRQASVARLGLAVKVHIPSVEARLWAAAASPAKAETPWVM